MFQRSNIYAVFLKNTWCKDINMKSPCVQSQIQKYTDKDKAKVLFCSAIRLKQLLFLSQTIYLGESRSPLLLSAPWIHLELLSCRRRKVSAKELLRCLCFVMNVWKGGGLSPRRTLTYHHQSYSPPQHPQTHKISRKFRSDKYVSAPPQLRAGANLESQCFSCTLWISTPNSYT